MTLGLMKQAWIPAAIDPQVAASLETPGQAKLSLSPGTYDFGGVPLEQSGRYTMTSSRALKRESVYAREDVIIR